MSNAMYANEPTITPKLCERSSAIAWSTPSAPPPPATACSAADAPAPAEAARVGAALAERAQQPRAQADEQRTERGDQRRNEREHHRTPARQDAGKHADPDQDQREEVRGARDDEERDGPSRDVAGRHPGLAQRPDAEREPARRRRPAAASSPPAPPSRCRSSAPTTSASRTSSGTRAGSRRTSRPRRARSRRSRPGRRPRQAIPHLAESGQRAIAIATIAMIAATSINRTARWRACSSGGIVPPEGSTLGARSGSVRVDTANQLTQ